MQTSQMLAGQALLEAVRADFVGLDTAYTLADGERSRRVYLDSAATCLQMRPVGRACDEFLRHYANTHSSTHFSARISTAVYDWAHQRILNFLGADPEVYACVFVGSGATAGFNRVASVLHGIRPERDTVLVSMMEHHSNDLPHRRRHQQVLRIPTSGADTGALCLDTLESQLKANPERVNYVAVTAASNVTGVCNPVADIIRLAHAHGALAVIDASQAIAHRGFSLAEGGNCAGADAFVFSGHKLYAPGSPGVLICRKALLDQVEPYEIGGGTVDHVYLDRYELLEDYPDREEAGTPNILGAAKLAFTIELLDRIGMAQVTQDEHRLLDMLDRGLKALEGVRVYGVEGVPLEQRTSTLSFAMEGMDHGLLAAVLNDQYGIAVRNQCFCAHPYVRELIKQDLWALPEELLADPTQLNAKQGLVRVSLGLYNDEADIQYLLAALRDIWERRETLLARYQLQADGSYRDPAFFQEATTLFDPAQVLDQALGTVSSREKPEASLIA